MGFPFETGYSVTVNTAGWLPVEDSSREVFGGYRRSQETDVAPFCEVDLTGSSMEVIDPSLTILIPSSPWNRTSIIALQAIGATSPTVTFLAPSTSAENRGLFESLLDLLTGAPGIFVFGVSTAIRWTFLTAKVTVCSARLVHWAWILNGYSNMSPAEHSEVSRRFMNLQILFCQGQDNDTGT